ncbi:hypothetical protein CLCR_05031 [Cladophialophora carrionii]|uniref:Uncharacterized protein n=1 Tax=Cladophialophora carrionii TaxID=86049 RepID=A0A1C1CJE5_9EURO|nr:hypothetical protein CLCR_05031 [Cladophialophora carrionii]
MEPPKNRSQMRYSSWFSKRRSREPRPVRQARPERDVAVAERMFGKAYVNCALRGNSSKWSKLQGKDAAVLQLLIDPRQDDGFNLKELVVALSFVEELPSASTVATTTPTGVVVSTAARPTIGAVPTMITARREPSLIILEPPSPKYLKRRATTRHSSREVLLQPQLGAGGVSVSGVGTKFTNDGDVERSWRFQSHRANNETGVYTTAKWTWKAVAENPDIEDVGALFAGVIIQHPGQPFYLSCKVTGKLVQLGKKFRYGNDDDRPYHTLVHPKLSQQDLEVEAEQLEENIVDPIAQAAVRLLIPEGDEQQNPAPSLPPGI